MHVLGRDRGQPRGAGVDAVDERGHDLPARGQGAVGERVVPLEGGDGDGRGESEGQVGRQGQLGVQAPRAGAAASAHDVQDDGEADGAHEGPQDDRQADPPVGGVGLQALGHDDEAGVVEDRQRHEDRIPQGVAHIEAVTEEGRQQHERQEELAAGGRVDDGAQQPPHLTQARLVLRGRQHPLSQSHVPGHRQGQQGGQGHDSQTAHGRGQDDDDVSEGGPVDSRVHRAQAGDAHGRGGGEQGVEEVGVLPAGRGDGEAEEAGHHHDDGREDDHGQPGRVEAGGPRDLAEGLDVPKQSANPGGLRTRQLGEGRWLLEEAGSLFGTRGLLVALPRMADDAHERGVPVGLTAPAGLGGAALPGRGLAAGSAAGLRLLGGVCLGHGRHCGPAGPASSRFPASWAGCVRVGPVDGLGCPPS